MEEERTPEMDSELARAYNNLADPGKPEGIDMFRRAIGLLKRHEEYFEGDHFWNFRMGYAYYHLDQEGIALRYFEKSVLIFPLHEGLSGLRKIRSVTIHEKRDDNIGNYGENDCVFQWKCS